jgi:hypothetical protein
MRPLLPLALALALGCQQRAEPAWPDTVRSWQAAEAELADTTRAPLAQLDERAVGGEPECAELAQSMRNALAELEKTRLTAEAEVKSGRWTVEQATARMTQALAKAEQRAGAAVAKTSPAQPERGKPGTPSDEQGPAVSE